MFKYQGKNVIIMLCSKCNANCKHCYIKYKGNFDLEKLFNLYNSIKDKYFIILNGTEPILFKEYLPLFKENNQSRLLTNGIELMNNPNIKYTLKENGIKELAISYHYGIQDDISPIKSYMLDPLFNELIDSGFDVKMMCSVSTDNYLLIPEACQYAASTGIKTIKFTNYVYQGRAQDGSFDKILDQDKINKALNLIDECRKIYPKEVLSIERCGTFGPNLNRPDKFECLAVNNMVVVTPDLNVYRCVFDIAPGNEIGKVIDNQIMINDEFKTDDKSFCRVLRKYNRIGDRNE